ncbi:zinc finger CCCH domain-containing protein 22-like isoform X4 [Cynara cardunculus var. scolymus]|uniref:zinc finger CCCH domain-containing protein 22-like isoform X4 n=1 Tax=Cynara cardunculus var. scolymus TaxID=59895 RepID=UPI000D62D141|nr:zinc finger CCCH domain-containing protein 22-like isoform X4 [Cynara cardunculus var. scolymus]
MDTVEATKMVMSRIQKLDPENASKIMGYILIQDQGDNEMIRLAFGPENLLLSVIKQAKSFLDISSNTSSAPSSTTPSLFIHRNSPQIVIPNNGFHHMNPPSPSSPWSLSGSFPDHHLHRGSPRPVSYAAVVNGGGSSASSFYNNFNDPTDEYSTNNGLQVVSDQLSFFDESKNVDFIDPMVSPGGRSDSVLFPYPNDTSNWPMVSGNCGDAHHHHLHRRSCSVNDVFLGGGGGGNDDMGGGGGFGGWRPCMYFARGFCKNGTSCKFVHGGFGDEIGLNPSSPTAVAGSPTGKIDSFDDLLRIKAIQQQQQRIAAMAGGGVPPFPFNRCMNFLNENPRSAAALMMGDEFHKFSRCRPDRNDFAAMGLGNSNSSSRQIYLTFPADSTFKEEDVSNYFRKHQQQMERGDFSGCLSPTALESAEPFDHIPFGARMFNQEMILRRKLEERAELQQAMEFQDRRLMNLQLSDLKNHHFHPNLSVSSPTQSCAQINQNLLFSSDGNNEELVSGAKISTHDSMNSLSDESDPNVPPEVKVNDGNSGSNGTGKEEISDQNETDKHESSLEHILPDNLFASPKKSAAIDNQTIFSTDMPETDDSAATASSLSAANDIQVLPTTSTPLEMLASLNSCYFQMPRKMEE